MDDLTHADDSAALPTSEPELPIWQHLEDKSVPRDWVALFCALAKFDPSEAYGSLISRSTLDRNIAAAKTKYAEILAEKKLEPRLCRLHVAEKLLYACIATMPTQGQYAELVAAMQSDDRREKAGAVPNLFAECVVFPEMADRVRVCGIYVALPLELGGMIAASAGAADKQRLGKR